MELSVGWDFGSVGRSEIQRSVEALPGALDSAHRQRGSAFVDRSWIAILLCGTGRHSSQLMGCASVSCFGLMILIAVLTCWQGETMSRRYPPMAMARWCSCFGSHAGEAPLIPQTMAIRLPLPTRQERESLVEERQLRSVQLGQARQLARTGG